MLSTESGDTRTTTQIRAEIVGLYSQPYERDENGHCIGPEWEAARRRIQALASILQARGHACIFCAFGMWGEKHERCEHE